MADNTPRVTLRFFQVELRKAHTKDSFEPLFRFGQNHDLLPFLQETIANWATGENQRIVNDAVNQKILRRRENQLHLGTRRVFGFLEAGEYGFEAELIDAESGEKKYHKKKGDAELTPFYFHFFIPENRMYGLLVLQSYKNRGIQTLLFQAVSQVFRQKYSEHILDFKPLASKELAEKFMDQGVLGKVVFRDTNSLSRFNPFEMEGVNVNRDDYDIEVRIIPKRSDDLLKKVWRRTGLANGQRLHPILRIDNFTPTSTEVTLKLNGRDRTLSLDRLDQLGTFFDITDDVIFDEDTMHPTFESVHEQAQSILDGIYAQIEENSGPR